MNKKYQVNWRERTKETFGTATIVRASKMKLPQFLFYYGIYHYWRERRNAGWTQKLVLLSLKRIKYRKRPISRVQLRLAQARMIEIECSKREIEAEIDDTKEGCVYYEHLRLVPLNEKKSVEKTTQLKRNEG